jgi:hypothetical protein
MSTGGRRGWSLRSATQTCKGLLSRPHNINRCPGHRRVSLLESGSYGAAPGRLSKIPLPYGGGGKAPCFSTLVISEGVFFVK